MAPDQTVNAIIGTWGFFVVAGFALSSLFGALSR
jgi:hypothetical protein